MITPKDVDDRRVRLRVEDRTATFVKFLQVGTDLTGGVLVRFDEGNVTSAYANDDAILVLDDMAALPKVTAWECVGPGDWISFYVNPLHPTHIATAARVDSTGWIAYSPERSHVSGRCEGASDADRVLDGRNRARAALVSFSVDASALDTASDVDVVAETVTAATQPRS
jgi:hypothetical protein